MVKKQIVFCGTVHLQDRSDIENPMYRAIEKKFFSFKPSICVNEGGDVSKKKYASWREAMTQNGEIGLIKVLADSLGIGTVNGDMTDSLEFKALLKKYTTGEFLAYIATERFFWQLSDADANDSSVVKLIYSKFINDYIVKEGNVHLKEQEKTLAFFEANYAKLLHHPFDIHHLEPTNPFDAEGKFQEIGRASKEIRDQSLLQTIDTLLDTYDKVFIVFGGWHLLTCKPGLDEIIKKPRT
ncbi:MAG: hypothetical protein ABIQ40_00065 [Bacteroidia bacterium]